MCLNKIEDSPAPSVEGRYCGLSGKEATGVALLVLGVVMIVFAALLASGRWGGGVMNFIGAGLALLSLPVFLLAAKMLIHLKPGQQMGNPLWERGKVE